jgi:hypothetical protein
VHGRTEAEAANADVEAMIDEVQHIRLGRQRMVFSIAGFDQGEPPLNQHPAISVRHLP